MEQEKIVIPIILGAFFFALFFLFFLVLIIFYFRKLFKMRAEREQLEAQIAEEVNNARNEIQQLTLNNISQEIHDNVGQLLSLAKMQLNLIEEAPEKDGNLIRETKENISKAMSDLRDLAKGMSSDRIKVLGLYDSVTQEAERISKVGAFTIEVNCSGDKKEPNHQKQLVIFRVIQECFQNIIKHAHATEVNIFFTYQPGGMDISIQDNGRGFEFNPEKFGSATGGLGLMNLFNRVNLVGGTAKVNSAPGKGTQVLLYIPL
ncbi:MAG: sensor histidine kinase [Bacteroidota bacterium]